MSPQKGGKGGKAKVKEAKATDIGQIESSFVVLQKEKSEELGALEERK